MEDRVEVCRAENGFTVKIWKEEEKEEASEMMYYEPTTYVASDLDEATKIIKENF